MPIEQIKTKAGRKKNFWSTCDKKILKVVETEEELILSM